MSFLPEEKCHKCGNLQHYPTKTFDKQSLGAIKKKEDSEESSSQLPWKVTSASCASTTSTTEVTQHLTDDGMFGPEEFCCQGNVPKVWVCSARARLPQGTRGWSSYRETEKQQFPNPSANIRRHCASLERQSCCCAALGEALFPASGTFSTKIRGIYFLCKTAFETTNPASELHLDPNSAAIVLNTGALHRNSR